jgi:hypothetical protein
MRSEEQTRAEDRRRGTMMNSHNQGSIRKWVFCANAFLWVFFGLGFFVFLVSSRHSLASKQGVSLQAVHAID